MSEFIKEIMSSEDLGEHVCVLSEDNKPLCGVNH